MQDWRKGCAADTPTSPAADFLKKAWLYALYWSPQPTGVIDGFLQETGPVGPYLLGGFISSLWSLGKEETFTHASNNFSSMLL